MYITTPTEPTARKSHRCHWCAELIEIGAKYLRWCCFGLVPVPVHEECQAAWLKGMAIDPAYYGAEVQHGEHCRGCLCESGHCTCGNERPDQAEAVEGQA